MLLEGSSSGSYFAATFDHEKDRIELCSSILRDLLRLYENLEKKRNHDSNDTGLMAIEVCSYRRAIRNIQTVVRELESVEETMITASREANEDFPKKELLDELKRGKADYRCILAKAKEFEEKIEEILRQSDVNCVDCENCNHDSRFYLPFASSEKMELKVDELTDMCSQLNINPDFLLDPELPRMVKPKKEFSKLFRSLNEKVRVSLGKTENISDRCFMDTENVAAKRLQTLQAEEMSKRVEAGIKKTNKVIPIDARYAMIYKLEKLKTGKSGILPAPYLQFLPRIPLSQPFYYDPNPHHNGPNSSNLHNRCFWACYPPQSYTQNGGRYF